MVLSYTQSIDLCWASALGGHGLTSESFEPYTANADNALQQLQAELKDGSLPLLTLPAKVEDLHIAEGALADFLSGAKRVVFFGTGGSSLGGQTLAQIAQNSPSGPTRPDGGQAPAVVFCDNLDATTLNAVLAPDTLSQTRFVVTSKSGGTAETLAQAIAALSAVDKAGLSSNVPSMFLGLTEPDKAGKVNGLRALFASRDIPLLEHHTGIGGRYSCLTNVGLLPAKVLGVDVFDVRKGAASVLEALAKARTAAEFPPAFGAAAMLALVEEHGTGNLVMMPYDDRLARFAGWYVQLWAESIGKDGRGSTPMACLGPLDQHSQLQLFMDGPRSHAMTILRCGDAPEAPVIDADMAALAGCDYLAGRKVGDVVRAQAHALPEALAKAGRPVRTFDIPSLTPFSLGALLMHFMLETILAGRMMGIDPFDQPAVELAKVLTRQRLQAP
ncbi:MAG: glucose-6-phosphate isomerase [Pseudomonadota bacterium]